MDESMATRTTIYLTLWKAEAAELIQILETLKALPEVVVRLKALLDMACEED